VRYLPLNLGEGGGWGINVDRSPPFIGVKACG
jgi:hypothetical protein